MNTELSNEQKAKKADAKLKDLMASTNEEELQKADERKRLLVESYTHKLAALNDNQKEFRSLEELRRTIGGDLSFKMILTDGDGKEHTVIIDGSGNQAEVLNSVETIFNRLQLLHTTNGRIAKQRLDDKNPEARNLYNQQYR